jgi:hypothetical protein
MALLEDTFIDSLAAVRFAASILPTTIASVRPLDDDHLIDAQRLLAEARRALDASASLIAGEIAYRSRRELGLSGLAQRQGFRTAEKLVQHATGSTARDATALVTVGTLVHDAEVAGSTPLDESGAPIIDLPEPWLVAVGSAVAAGSLSIEAARAIQIGLGCCSEHVTAQSLSGAVDVLLDASANVHADALLALARRLRDELDIAGVAERERQIHEERSIRRVRRTNGLSRYIIDPDIEGAAFWDELYDRITAPRRGNVSFMSPEDRAWADSVSGRADHRTVDQYVHDTFTELLRLAVASDTPTSRGLLGSRQPAVRVLVTAEALHKGQGVGHIEGIATPVSMKTVERIACAEGTVTLTFDAEGNGLDLGREQRLFTVRQRVVISARDGGCLFPECDRPPGWCEAHHIDHWWRDQGQTNLARGVLLCRHHHMLVHNNGWEIEHDDAGYWLIPPATIDPQRSPRAMPSKSAAMRELRTQQGAQLQ